MSKSTIQTAIAVANSMVGTSLLVLPVNYLEKGILQNAIGAVIMCIIMGSTAYMIGTLLQGRHKQFFDVVSVELGKKWSQFMAVIGALLTLLVGCIVFLLASDNLFELFSSFSDSVMQMGPKLFRCLLIVPFVPFCFLNSLQLVVKIGPLSMGLIWLYILTILYSFVENISNIDANVLKSKQINFSNLQYWLAVQGFAFICHPTLDAVIKENKNKKTNGRAVIIGYALGFVIMVACGSLGALALYKKQKKKEDDNIIDYFSGHWQYYSLGFSMFIYLLSIFPIFPYVTRTQIYSILPDHFKESPAKTHNIIKTAFIVLFLILNVCFVILQTSPAIVMGFLVTVICFYICYLVPVLIKLKKLNHPQLANNEQNNQNVDNNSLISDKQDTEQLKYSNTSKQIMNQSQDEQLSPLPNKNVKMMKKIGYIFVLIVGFGLLLSQIWQISIGK